MAVLILIFGLLCFVGLIVLHELGHAFVAWRNGVGVEEFGIGFPPRLWSKKLNNGTLFTINLLPLGGFVRLKGENDSAEGPGTYGGSSLWVKTKILLAGVVVNWLTAVVIFTILALTGMPQLIDNQFTVASDTATNKQDVIAASVVAGSPADKAGLKAGDKILQIDGQSITSNQKLVESTAAGAGKTVKAVFVRQGSQQQAYIQLNKNRVPNEGYAGIGTSHQGLSLNHSTWSAPIVGVGVTMQFTVATFANLGSTIAHLFHQEYKQAGASVAGPIGIFSILQQSSVIGLTPVIFFIGIISLTLAIMNVLPIPALDGGRLFVTVLFRVTKLKLTKKREETIQIAGFLTLTALVLVITVVDIGRLIHK
ncbi:MAG TPA: M50 family metallopeptidase [Patescibacteria group bacterium]|jgi:regulator of sigma E protease|nr:M50 family metallopeptidase [Patescibacteria group bacterium]